MGREASKVRVTITDILGTGECSQGFKKGDTWLIEDNITPTNFCMFAFGVIYPTLKVMRFGGAMPWGNSEVTALGCPDFNHTVIYEIRRLPPE